MDYVPNMEYATPQLTTVNVTSHISVIGAKYC